MKKLFTLAISLALCCSALVFGACGKKKNPTPAPQSSSSPISDTSSESSSENSSENSSEINTSSSMDESSNGPIE